MKHFINLLITSLILSLGFSFAVQASKSTPLKVNCSQEPVACAVYKEARGESVKGQYAVAFVVYNRVADKRFPKTAKSVVYQKNQFSWTRKPARIHDKEAFAKARRIASEVNQLRSNPALYKKRDVTNGALYFNHSQFRTKHFNANRSNVVVMGNHIFYGKVSRSSVVAMRSHVFNGKIAER